MPNRRLQLLGVLALGTGVGVMAGLLGVGGGALLVPLLVLLFDFQQHRAQGTSLVALVPPTGALAFLVYYKAGQSRPGERILRNASHAGNVLGRTGGRLPGAKAFRGVDAARFRRTAVLFGLLAGDLRMVEIERLMYCLQLAAHG